MSYEQSPLIQATNNIIRVKHPNTEYNPRTYLGASVAAAGTALTVRDNAGFLLSSTNNERALIGSYGDERCEIKRITADPAAGTSLTVAAVTFAHPIDTPITNILWDRVEIVGNSTNTTVGATSIITTALTPDEDFTQYTVTGTTYAFYFARYNNSTSGTNSSYSDGVASTGYAATTRAMIKQRAIARSGIQLGFPVADGEVITDEYLNGEIVNCEQDIQQRSLKWAFLATDNFLAPISLIQGQRRYTMPATILDANSNRSVISMKVSWNQALIYLYPQEFNARTTNIVFTTLAANVGLADVTITLTDSSDFGDTGTILIGNDTITYTANSRSTNVLSGVTGIDATHTSGDEVYQNAVTGQPYYYTIKNGTIYLHPTPDSTFNLRNLNIEFYRTLASMTTDGTATVVPFYTIFDIWLLWRIAERRKLFDEAKKWEQEYEMRLMQGMQAHVAMEDLKFYPGLAEPQLLEYDRGRIISSSLN